MSMTTPPETTRALHALADRLTGAGGDVDLWVNVNLTVLGHGGGEAGRVAAVDELAVLLGLTAQPAKSAGGWVHKASDNSSGLRIQLCTYIDTPAQHCACGVVREHLTPARLGPGRRPGGGGGALVRAPRSAAMGREVRHNRSGGAVMTGICTPGRVRPLTVQHLRVLVEVDAGNVSYLPQHGAAVMAPAGHPTRRTVVTRTVGELLSADYLEIGPGHGRRIPVVLSARGREAVAVARTAATS